MADQDHDVTPLERLKAAALAAAQVRTAARDAAAAAFQPPAAAPAQPGRKP